MLRAEPLPHVALERDERERPVVALDEPGGDDPDHARVPAGAGEHVARALPERGDLCLGFEEHARLGVATLLVGAVELVGDLRRAHRVLGEDQLERGVGAVEAAGRVQARRQPEAHRALVHAARVDAGAGHERAQPGLRRARERAQAAARERTVLAAQGDAVGDRRERHEIEVLGHASSLRPLACASASASL